MSAPLAGDTAGDIAGGTTGDGLAACPECDRLHVLLPVRPGEKAACVRCGTVLYRAPRWRPDEMLAVVAAALIAFALANAYPILELRVQGIASAAMLPAAPSPMVPARPPRMGPVQMNTDEIPISPAPGSKTERILAASEPLFLEFGYAATSMNLVANRAGVSKSTLYARFSSKEELFAATIQAACKRHDADVPLEALADLPLEDALFQVGRRFVDLLWSPGAIRTRQSAVSEAARLPEVGELYLHAGPERIVSGFTALFARIAQRDSARIGDPVFAARQFLAALLGDTYYALELGLCDYPSEEERDAFTRRAVALFVRGIHEVTA